MIRFTRILCPIDFSDTSTRSLARAATWAAWYDAALDVVHVLPPPAPALTPAHESAPADLTPPAPRDMVLGAIAQALEAAGVDQGRVEALVLDGVAPDEIAERARASGASLIVMGTHGRSGFNRLLLGSVTEKVLRAAPCPVLTVPSAAAATAIGTFRLQRILCAIDYSPSSLEALRYALELGRQSGGRVTVLNALEYMDPEVPCEHVDPDIRARRAYYIDHAKTRLHALLEGEPTTWCEIEEVVTVDRAYKAVLQHASSGAYDLIVMGAQGTSGLELMLYGSNTQHVLRSATIPVLTVHS